MIELTDQEKQVIKKVVDKMVAGGGLFAGNYDARNGNEDFMYGISTTMEYFAHLVDENYGIEFSDKFTMNMLKSWRERDYDENC